MATIVTRETTQTDGTSPKGSPLTNAEVDTNFINLNDNKVEVSGAIVFAAKAGEALTKGEAVYVSGVSGNEPVVSKADADAAGKMPAFGLAETDASLNAAVNVVIVGTLYDIDTSGFATGDTVYVSTTPGALTNTKPAGESARIQNVGKVIRSHASAGSIKVAGAGRANETPNLNDGNVFIGNASNQAAARALTTADIASGTFADARIAQSNVTQHQAALSITESQISDLQAYLTAESDTLDSVTGRGATTTNAVTVGNLTSTGIDDNATSTAITLDSSGNLLVGTTNVANSATVPGHYILPSGLHTSTRDGGAIRILNRLTSDGDLMIFRKDGTNVGSIGNDSTALTIGSGSTGFKFGTSAVWATTGGATNANGTKDLGASTVRWKDLYLSGTAYTANIDATGTIKLDGNFPTGTANTALGDAALDDGSLTGGYNTAIGNSALGENESGNYSTAVGFQAMALNTTGYNNVAVGANSLLVNTTGALNVAVGDSALAANTTANFNTAVGRAALTANTTGSSNTAVGYTAGSAITTGHSNTAVGSLALDANTTGDSNVAVGYSSLGANTTAVANAAFGLWALKSNTSGNYNTAIGSGRSGSIRAPLEINTTGTRNVAVGTGALGENNANDNTAVGYAALYSNTTGTPNTAVGYQALYSNTTGVLNDAFGYYALRNNTTGSNNTALGYGTLSTNTTGYLNTAVGRAALNVNTTGAANTAVGYNSMVSVTTGGNNTALGYNTLSVNTTGSQNVAVGSAALDANTIGAYNVAVGYGAAGSLTTDAYNVAVGFEALGDFTSQGTSGNVAVGGLSQRYATSYYNVSVGYQSLQSVTSHSNTAIGHRALLSATAASDNTAVGVFSMDVATTGSYSTAIGAYALSSTTTGSYNTAVGRNAHGGLTTGANNTAVGNDSGYSISSGTVNTHVGVEAGYAVTTGSHNVGVGYQANRNAGAGNYGSFLGNYAGRLTTGNSNVSVGYASMYYNQSGYSNTAIGVNALYNSLTNQNAALGASVLQNQTSGNNNTAVGYAAGFSLTTGTSNTIVGGYNSGTAGAGYYMTTGSKNTIIGAYNGNQHGLDLRTASNRIVLSDGDGNPRIYIDSLGNVKYDENQEGEAKRSYATFETLTYTSTTNGSSETETGVISLPYQMIVPFSIHGSFSGSGANSFQYFGYIHNVYYGASVQIVASDISHSPNIWNAFTFALTGAWNARKLQVTLSNTASYNPAQTGTITVYYHLGV